MQQEVEDFDLVKSSVELLQLGLRCSTWRSQAVCNIVIRSWRVCACREDPASCPKGYVCRKAGIINPARGTAGSATVTDACVDTERTRRRAPRATCVARSASSTRLGAQPGRLQSLMLVLIQRGPGVVPQGLRVSQGRHHQPG